MQSVCCCTNNILFSSSFKEFLFNKYLLDFYFLLFFFVFPFFFFAYVSRGGHYCLLSIVYIWMNCSFSVKPQNLYTKIEFEIKTRNCLVYFSREKHKVRFFIEFFLFFPSTFHVKENLIFKLIASTLSRLFKSCISIAGTYRLTMAYPIHAAIYELPKWNNK